MSGTLGGGVSTPGTADTSFIFAPERSQQAQNPLAMQNQLLDTVNKVGALKLQQQQITGGAAGLAQKMNQIGAANMLPWVGDPNGTMEGLTNLMGHIEGTNKGVSQGVQAQLASIPYAPNTPEWKGAANRIITTQSQTNPEAALSSITPQFHTLQDNQTLQPGVVAPPSSTTPGTFQPRGAGYQIQPTPGDLMQPRSVFITRQNFQQYGQPESAIGSTISVPTGAVPGAYRGTVGPGATLGATGAGAAQPQTGAPGQNQNLPRGLRNNNPLNLEFAPGQGAVGSDGRFGIYSTPAAGMAAAQSQLLRYQDTFGLKTVGDIINRWAPPGENDTAAYAANVAKSMGVKVTDPIDLHSPDTMNKMTSAMSAVENGRGAASGGPAGNAPTSSAPLTGTTPGGTPATLSVGGQPVTTPGAPPAGAVTSSQVGVPENIQANQAAFLADKTKAATLPLQNTQFQEAHDAITRLQTATAGTGPGRDAVTYARRVMSNLGYSGYDDVIKDAATGEKYLAAAVLAQSGRSDMQQTLASHATPNLDMPPGASLPIIRQAVASNRATQLIAQSAPDQEAGTGYINHRTTQSQILNSKEGLQALSWDMQPPAERSQILTDLKKKGNEAALGRFQDAFRMAHNSGQIAPAAPVASQ